VVDECSCGSTLGCMIAANGNVELFFALLGKYPVAIFLWISFADPPFH